MRVYGGGGEVGRRSYNKAFYKISFYLCLQGQGPPGALIIFLADQRHQWMEDTG